MASDPGQRYHSPLVGDLGMPAPGSDDTNADDAVAVEPAAVLLELNMLYPGGLTAVTADFFALWERLPDWAHAAPSAEPPPGQPMQPPVPAGLRRVTSKLYECVVTRAQLRTLVAEDRSRAQGAGRPLVLFKAWPDYELYPLVDRSAPTVKADAARRPYNARGRDIVWAVIDSGIDGCHPHFSALDLAIEAGAVPGAPSVRTAGLHRNFSALVRLPSAPLPDPPSPLSDEQGHGTHVAGIIAGAVPEGRTPYVAASDEPPRPGRGNVHQVATEARVSPSGVALKSLVVAASRPDGAAVAAGGTYPSLFTGTQPGKTTPVTAPVAHHLGGCHRVPRVTAQGRRRGLGPAARGGRRDNGYAGRLFLI